MSPERQLRLSQPDPQLVNRIAEAIGMSAIAATCLINRGITDPAAARDAVHTRLGRLLSPTGMADLEKATERTFRAIVEQQRIGVFGDYDVDGVTSAALTATFLRDLRAAIHIRIADRFSGYGLSTAAIDEFAAAGCRLVIALDCGTSDFEAAEHAAKNGVDLVIIDHHRVEQVHPPAFAFVNPQRADCEFADKHLAAVGLAFYFVAALRTKLCQKAVIKRDELDPRTSLDLVALGTVADVMPLRNNNRILVKHGLERMSTVPRPGLEALIRTARIRSARLRSDHIAFQLAPRINAAGRMSHAKEAFELLWETSRQGAERHAATLDRLSKLRRVVEGEVLTEARHQIADQRLADHPVIIVAGDGWHQGVLGIVAARLVEQTGKTTMVISFSEQLGVASARGQGQLDLYQCLHHGASLLERFGGHHDAAGFTIKSENLPAFRAAINAYASDHQAPLPSDEIGCDAQLRPADLCTRLLDELDQLGPFGEGFAEPVFAIPELYVLDKRIVGQHHLKLDLKLPSGTISAFGPHMGEHIDRVAHAVAVVANLTRDEWRGGNYPELRLVIPPLGD